MHLARTRFHIDGEFRAEINHFRIRRFDGETDALGWNTGRKPTAKQHETLAANISLALITTLMGLALAIPCIALFTFFRNRIDALGSEAGMEIERLVLHLESESAGPGAASPPPAPRPQPGPRTGPVSGGPGGTRGEGGP